MASVRRLRSSRIALALCLLAILWVRLGDPFGDRGMSNVVTGVLLIAAALGLLCSFAFRRSIPRRRRLAVLGALAVVLASVAATVRVEGVSGELIPDLVWRSRARAPGAPAAARSGLTLGAPASSDFPAFLGPRRDNRVAEVELARDWNARPPRERWRAPIGAGWSAFAAAGGWAFTLEQDAAVQRVSARSIASGELAWSVELDQPFDHPLGGAGPRSTPAVELEEAGGDGRVYALSA